MVVDFKHVKEIVSGQLDHRYANDVVNFNPTAENLARWICEQVPNAYKVSFQGFLDRDSVHFYPLLGL